MPSPAALLASQGDEAVRAFLASLTDAEAALLQYEWEDFWARPDQREPPGDWLTWAAIAGRGWGKTRTGVEWVRKQIETGRAKRVALVAETSADARDVMVEGESGFLACCPPWNRPLYEPSKRRLTWPNGAIATLYNATEPGQLRGPQHDAAWCDELAKWRYINATWDNLQMGLRLGDRPRVLVTTTPRPIRAIRDLLAQPDTVVTKGTTHDNMANLSRVFARRLMRYEGTVYGRQEIYGAILDDGAGAILPRHWWQAWAERALPPVSKVILSFDTAYEKTQAADYTAFTVWGLFELPREKLPGVTPARGLILLDAWQRKLNFPELREIAREEVKAWTLNGVPPDYVLVERKGSGISLIQELETAGVKVASFDPFRESKIMRANVVSPAWKHGLIWAPAYLNRDGQRDPSQFQSFAEMVVEQCDRFPPEPGSTDDDAHDDLVDSSVQAIHLARRMGLILFPDELDELARQREARITGRDRDDDPDERDARRAALAGRIKAISERGALYG